MFTAQPQHCVTQPTPPFEIGPQLTLEGGATWRARVHQVPAARDNLCWLIEYEPQRVALVDGPRASEVASYLATRHLTLTHVLNTHTHGDHIGVNRELTSRGLMEGVEVWASALAPVEVPGLTRSLHDGEHLSLGPLKGFVWLTEGHLNGHISFVWGAQEALSEDKERSEEGSPALFCGDTLFAGGCGYVFDGPMATMATSLERLASLPPSTWVCCAHEYTLDNLHFALSVEPDNQALSARVAQVIALREAGGCAVPSRLSEELESNPFVRAVMGTLHPSTSLDTQPLDTQPLGVEESVAERFERVRRLKDSKAYRERPLNALISRD